MSAVPERVERARLLLAERKEIVGKAGKSGKDVDKAQLGAEQIVCLECARSMRNMYLPEHILTHGVTLQEYIDKHYEVKADV